MAWSKSVTLWCDEEECPRHTGELPFRRVSRARHHATENMGWSFDRQSREDYCPTHSDGGES